MPDAFVARCLLLDLETHLQDRIFHIGAVLGGEAFERQGDFRLEEALAELDRRARQADYVLGHNLLGHDLPVLRKLAPGLTLLEKPVVDTLYLSPLAFPENPYHHLVKDYKLVRSSVNQPVADARLAARVFRDQWDSFARAAAGGPELLAFYAFCLVHDADQGGLSAVFRAISGGEPMTADEAVVYLETSFAGILCRSALRTLASYDLEDRARRPAWAYVTAWLRVAGGNSVLPPWVRRRYPATVRILRALRDTPCGEPDCAYCVEMHDPRAQLRRFFGFRDFRPKPMADDGGSLQGAIIRRALVEKPHLAILATGAGKSICFQLPALVRYFRRGVLTIVVSPLQALMKDQVDNLNNTTGSDAAAALYGLLTPPERGAVLERLRLGDVALLYVAPEQLRNPSFRRVIAQREIGAWVFDEAHCLSKWGHDFRPDYLYAARFIKNLAREQELPVPNVACFTATAKRDVREEIVQHFAEHLGQELRVFASGIDRDELRFRVESVVPHEKLPRIYELLEKSLENPDTDEAEEDPSGSAVVYFASRRGAEEGADFLSHRGLVTAAFHAGLRSAEKRDILDDFVRGGVRVVCATNAFGMGIDKDDVRLVVHADVPGSLESYLQEAGRAGRDRLPSDCVLLFADADVEAQFKLAASSSLSQRDITQILRGLRRAHRRLGKAEGEGGTPGGEIVITTGELLRDEEVDPDFTTGDRQADTKVKTAVAWLERAAFLERDANRTRVFQGRVNVSSLDEAEERIRRLRLSHRERRRWLAILRALLNADPDDGLTADEIAEIPAVRWEDPAPDSTETPAQKVLRILHDMAEIGLLTSGLRLTAFLKPHGPGNASVVYDKVSQLERGLLDLLAETEPDADNGEWFELSLRPIHQRLADDGHESNPETLRRLLRSLAQDGKGLAGRRGSLELAYRAQGRYRVRLLRSWNTLRELASRRQAVGRTILDRLRSHAPREARGKVLVELGSDDLVDAIRKNLLLRGQIRDPLAAAERALLFLHEQKVIQLQQGLAVFRQAMTIRLKADAKGKRYTRGDFSPLAHHYGERTFQIHVMARYAGLGLEKIRSALELVSDYFELNRQRFVSAYFAGEEDILERATSRESFRRIVDELKNPAQTRLVAASPRANRLILAGPGSGKTRVVVHRCAYLLRVERVPARSILVVCFNRNAALEVRRRLRDLVGDDARGVTVQTYHGLAMRLTGTSFAPWGRVSPPRSPQGDKVSPPRSPQGDKVSPPRSPQGDKVSPPRSPQGDKVSPPRSPQGDRVSPPRSPQGDRVSPPRSPQGDRGAPHSFTEPDFSRLIPDAVRLLTSPETASLGDLPDLEADELRERLLAGYSHILVDEYQDVNQEQYDLVSALAGRTESDGERKLAILAVGDDDQNIYAWSGADVDFIRRFREDYAAEVHYLVENYRSPAHVIDASNQLVAHNSDRMKRDHPIRVNAARQSDPPGGRWARIEPATGGRVRILEVDDDVGEAAALAERLLEMRRLDRDLDWKDCAVLARRHAVLEPIRAVLEDRGVPISWTPDRGALPPLARVREIASLLRAFNAERREIRRASELEALRADMAGDDLDRVGPCNPWWRLLEEVLAEWREETGDAATAVGAAIEFVYEALAERRREPAFGDGVRLLTVHAAKGLEFRHVLMPGGFGWCPAEKLQEERRLYYVGMTRARETLHCCARRDEQNPHVVVLGGEPVERYAPHVERPQESVVRRCYRVLRLSDVFLGFPGYRGPEDALHQRLLALGPGSPLDGVRVSEGVQLVDASNEAVAFLSQEGVRIWGERLAEIESMRVLAMIERYAEDSEEPYRSRYRSERWEIPLVEVVTTARGDAEVAPSP